MDHEPLHRDLLIGAQAIADELGVAQQVCFRWLEKRYIPATKTGNQWTTTRSALRRHFSGESKKENASA
jgi:hypothetical protein